MSSQMTLDVLSDLHKDVYGFRPYPGRYDGLTEAQVAQEFEILGAALEEVVDAEEQLQKANVVEFERAVTNLLGQGARDRSTAIRWLIEAVDAGDDIGFAEYLYGVPYGYIEKGAAA